MRYLLIAALSIIGTNWFNQRAFRKKLRKLGILTGKEAAEFKKKISESRPVSEEEYNRAQETYQKMKEKNPDIL